MRNSQYGFRKNRSTCLAQTDLIQYIYQALNNKQQSFSIFLNICKAFDTVNHTTLLAKLYCYGVRMKNRKHCVRVGDTTSGYREINIGVLQWSVGGPILFLVYINDLPSVLNTLKTTLFSDDTVVSLAHPNLTSLVMSVSSELNVLCDWFQNNRLLLNITETYAMLCSASSNQWYQRTQRKWTERCYRQYLGIILDKQLSYKSHIDKIAKKISKLVRIFYKIKNYVPYTMLCYKCIRYTPPSF